jgi:hypothetical protein
MIDNPVPWPNGARVAVAITFDIDADSILHTDHRQNAHRMVATQSLLRAVSGESEPVSTTP